MLRIMRYALWGFVALGLGWLVWHYQSDKLDQQTITPPLQENKVAVDPSLAPGGDFVLIDHHGQKCDSRDFKDRYRLIYFGFTYCPAICPTELQKITDVMNLLKDKANLVQPLFITVDPERDTVDILKKYMANFHPSILGLTGNQAQIIDIIKSYRVTALKVPGQGGSNYLIDHTTSLYLMDPEGKFVTLFAQDKDAATIAKTLDEIIGLKKSP